MCPDLINLINLWTFLLTFNLINLWNIYVDLEPRVYCPGACCGIKSILSSEHQINLMICLSFHGCDCEAHWHLLGCIFSSCFIRPFITRWLA